MGEALAKRLGGNIGSSTESILLTFIIGLTTGGLACLAVQGGLLAGSLARQIEQDLLKYYHETAQPAWNS